MRRNSTFHSAPFASHAAPKAQIAIHSPYYYSGVRELFVGGLIALLVPIVLFFARDEGKRGHRDWQVRAQRPPRERLAVEERRSRNTSSGGRSTPSRPMEKRVKTYERT